MSTLVLARKYRPRRFEELVGQEHVVQALSHALASQRLHHAYLFTGTRGVGKTTVSRILAKALNCTGADGQGGITAEPCGQCPACRDIDAGRYVDYVELDAASNRGVEEISQLLDQAVYKPVAGRFKVYMIDEVHMLSTTAFNAMLKTLEEPPEYLKFVLATTDPQKVPPTVLSRCLQFNLRPMAPATVQSHLGEVLARESIDTDAGALRLLSRAAQGSMRDALSLTDQAVAFGGGRILEDAVRQMLGAVDRQHGVRVLQALAERDAAALLEVCDTLRSLGLSAMGLLEELATMLQQLAVLQAVPDAAEAGDPDQAALLPLTERFGADEVQVAYSIVLHGRSELPLAPDEHGGLSMILLRLLAFRGGGDDASRASAGRAGASTHRPALATAPAVARRPVPPPPTRGTMAAPSVAPRAPAASSALPTAAATSPTRDPLTSTSTSTSTASPAAARPAVAPTVVRAPVSPSQRLRPVVRAPGLDASQDERGDPGPSDDDVAAAGGNDEPPPWVLAPDDVESASTGATPSAAGSTVGTTATVTRPAAAASEAVRGRDLTPEPRALPPPTELDERWAALIGALSQEGAIVALARELAMQAQLIGVATPAHAAAPETWTLRVERESLRGQATRDKLQAALAQRLGHAVQLDLQPGVATDSPALREAAARARRQRAAEQIITSDPFVQSMLAQFRTARIVPGSIRPR